MLRDMTSLSAHPPLIRARPGEPVREIADYLPSQGAWTERQYLAVFTERGVEFNNGVLEVLPVPTKTHQLVIMWFCQLLKAFIGGNGVVVFAGYKLRVESPEVQFREPDVVYLTPEQNKQSGEQFTRAAEIVAEVVSPDDPSRDYVTKRGEYAAAGIPEYWILDPAARQVLVLGLEGDQYVERGKYGRGDRAASHHLPGFGVAVDDMLAQIQPQTVSDEA
jgi:Uma2 family endonuclease